MNELVLGDDGKQRCFWSSTAPEYPDYHDFEWGFPVTDDIRLFEKLSLEAFQSGLSWRTILVKRENFRLAFSGFDFNIIAHYTVQDIENLLQNEGIIRNRRKIEAVINNAKKAIEAVEQEGSLAALLWHYQPDLNKLPAPQSVTTSKESIALAKELKKRGWKFVGPTTAFAFMQSMGFFNDHMPGCCIREKVDKAISQVVVPGLKA